jgi:hypothetical protein
VIERGTEGRGRGMTKGWTNKRDGEVLVIREQGGTEIKIHKGYREGRKK